MKTDFNVVRLSSKQTAAKYSPIGSIGNKKMR